MVISWSIKTVAGSSCLKISKTITLTSNPSWNFTVGLTLATTAKTTKKEMKLIKLTIITQRVSFSRVLADHMSGTSSSRPRGPASYKDKNFLSSRGSLHQHFWVAQRRAPRIFSQIAIVSRALSLNEWEKWTELVDREKRNEIPGLYKNVFNSSDKYWGTILQYLI